MIRRSVNILVILSVLVLFGLESNYGHGDKKHDDNAETADTTSPADSSADFKAAQDSIFAIISEAYTKVEHILAQDCFNCHSDATDFPWYHSIPGISNFMNGHIEEAKEHIDFTYGFPFGGHGDPLSNLLEIKDEIKDGDMPLFSYRIMHWGSLIEDEEQDTLFQWIDQSVSMLRELYGKDSVTDNAEDDD